MTIRSIIAALLTALMLCAGVMAQESKAAAKVNGEAITEAQLRETLLDWYGKQILDEMIQALIIDQAAKSAKVTVTPEQVDERLKQMQTRMDERAKTGKGQPFAAWLASRRMTIPNLVAHLRTELLLETLVEKQVTVSPEEVSSLYEARRAMFQEPTRMKISVISLKTREQAEQVRGTIMKGDKTWADAARDHNINPYTMKTGGDLGYRTDDDTPLMKAAMALERDGDISAVVLYGGMYNIIKREDLRTARTVPFEDVKEQITGMLREQKLFKLMQENRTALMKSAHVERLIEFPLQAREGATGQ